MIIPYTIATSSKDVCWKSVSIITARKGGLGQGNAFTRVCHSVHGESAYGVCFQIGSASRGDLPTGGLGKPPAPPQTRKAGGTHPTGMLSYS